MKLSRSSKTVDRSELTLSSPPTRKRRIKAVTAKVTVRRSKGARKKVRRRRISSLALVSEDEADSDGGDDNGSFESDNENEMTDYEPTDSKGDTLAPKKNG